MGCVRIYNYEYLKLLNITNILYYNYYQLIYKNIRGTSLLLETLFIEINRQL